MKILKALSLSFALGVLALAMLGAGGKGNVMPATKSGRMTVERLEPADAGAVDAGKKSTLYLHSTKAGPMPLVEPPPPQAPQQAPQK
jgi:hypothetical protein